jgi:antitoxin VapB
MIDTRGDAVETAKLFQNGRSQAVRLPKAFRFEGDEVYIKRVGNGVLLVPKENKPWSALFESLEEFEGELERNQPEHQERDWGESWQ